MNLSPRDLGLPEKIARWRPNQEECLRNTINAKERVTVVNAPTGFGKAPVYMAAAVAMGKRTCIVTPSRGLQDQLMDDYAGMGLVDLRGRANYSCDLKPDYTCEEGFAARCPYKGTVSCPASQAEMRAAAAPYVVTNYRKWTASKKFGQGMENFEAVIFDEAHHMPDALADALQVILHHREVEKDLEIDFLGGSMAEDLAEWKAWAIVARGIAEIKMVSALAKVAGVHDPKPYHVRMYTHMRHLMRRLATLSTIRPQDWVVDQKEEGFQFDPIRPGRYGESFLLFRVPRILAFSATIRPKSMYMTGIGKDNFKYYEYPSDFDPKRCPTYYVPTQHMNRRFPDLSMCYVRIDQILAKRMDRKGIIQSISFDRRDDIVNSSRFSPIMLINPRGESVTATVSTFKKSPPPMYLTSPSVGEGYDFPMDECEVQIITKLPFEPPSKINKAREQDDKEYGPYRCMNKLVQMIGRGMRSKEDSCENFIIDNDIEWFRGMYSHLAPRTFHQFFRQVVVLPKPLPKL